jgi:hypothetical protein
MTVTNVLIYLALIGYVLFKKVQGQPVAAPKRLFGLPIVLIVLGYGDLTHAGAMAPIEIAVTVIGGALSLGLGLLRGRADKLSQRDGSPFVSWGTASLILFVGNLAAKLVLDLIGVAAGARASTVGNSLLLTFGLTLLGEAVVIWLRTGGATGLLTPSAQAGDPRS